MQEPMFHSCLPLDAVARAAASSESESLVRHVAITFFNGMRCQLEFAGKLILLDGKPVWGISSHFPNSRAALGHWPCIGKLPQVAAGYHFMAWNQDGIRYGTVVSISSSLSLERLSRD